MNSPESTYPFVSVIVPVLNGEVTIRECLQSLLAQDYPIDRYEVVVVDNGSQDKTCEIVSAAKDSRVVFLQEWRKRSSYAARNLGIEKAKGSILVFTDADCVADKKWLKRMVPCFQDAHVGGASGDIKAFYPKTIIEQYQACRGELSQGLLARGPAGSFPPTANAAYRREIFQIVGCFDARLLSGGDLEFAKRLERKTKYSIVHIPDAIIYHHHRTDLFGLWEQRCRYGQGLAVLVHRDASLKPFLRIGSPVIYFIVGVPYFFFRWIKDLATWLKKRKKNVLLYAAWLDLYGEIAFRAGYQQGLLAAHPWRRYKFYNFPRRIKAKDYKDAKERVLKQWRAIKSVSAVLSYGSSTSAQEEITRGISDIDLIPVVNFPSPKDIKDICDIRRKDPCYKDFFRNQEEVMIDQKCLSDMGYLVFDPGAVYRHEQGNPVAPEEIHGEGQKLCAMATTLGFLPVMILRNSYYLHQKCLDVKGALNLLYGQRHNLHRMEQLGVDVSAWQEMMIDVRDLRERWFAMRQSDKKKAIVKLLERNEELLQAIIGGLESFVQRIGLGQSIEGDAETVVLKIPENIFLVFSDKAWRENRGPTLSVDNIRLPLFFPASWHEIVKLAHWQVVILPRALASFFLVHASLEGEFGQVIKNSFLRKNFLILNKEQVPCLDCILRQSRAFDQYWLFLRSYGLRVGVSPFLNLFLEKRMMRSSGGAFVRGGVRLLLETRNYRRAINKLSTLRVSP